MNNLMSNFDFGMGKLDNFMNLPDIPDVPQVEDQNKKEQNYLNHTNHISNGDTLSRDKVNEPKIERSDMRNKAVY